MTPEDKKFVREMADDLFVNDLPKRWENLANVVFDGKRLLSLLIEAEGMREKAEFYKTHLDFSILTHSQMQDPEIDCFIDGKPCSNIRHDFIDADWIEQQRKELLG